MILLQNQIRVTNLDLKGKMVRVTAEDQYFTSMEFYVELDKAPKLWDTLFITVSTVAGD